MDKQLPRELRVQQGSDTWLKIRSGFITPSRFKTVVTGKARGLNSYLRELRSGEPKTINGPVAALEWGKYHETEALNQLRVIERDNFQPAGFFVHPTLSCVGGSPDAVVRASLSDKVMGGAEIKCPYNSHVHEETIFCGCPNNHYFQIQGYLWLLDAPWWKFVSYDPRQAIASKRVFIQHIPRDEVLIDQIRHRVSWFHDVLRSGAEVPDDFDSKPALDWKPLPRFF